MITIPIPEFIKESLPEASPALLQLANEFVQEGGLRATHFYTLRDWLEIAKYVNCDGLSALLLLLFLVEEEGSLCLEISRDSFLRRLRNLTDDSSSTVWTDAIMAALLENDFDELIGKTADDHRPVIKVTAGACDYLYFQKMLRHEAFFVAALQEKLAERPSVDAARNWQPILNEVLVKEPLINAAGAALHLDEDQKSALTLCLTSSFAIVSGGPGTGKTSLVLSLLRCLVRAGIPPDRIALAASTGRAAQRLTDAVHSTIGDLKSAADKSLNAIRAGTLHQLLEYQPSRNVFRRHVENPIQAEVVIVDEVSMAGIVLLSHLFRALAAGAKLILLGDKNQLPSVEAGAVLGQLVPEVAPPDAGRSHPLRNHVVVLTQNHRSEKFIRLAAQAINEQDVAIVEKLPTLTVAEFRDDAGRWQAITAAKGCHFLEQTRGTPDELRGLLNVWGQQVFLGARSLFQSLIETCVLTDSEKDEPDLKRIFSLLESNRLLTLVREGTWGCVDINRFLDQLLRPRLDRGSRTVLFAGAPVLVTRNDHTRELYNGDVGVALRSRNGLRVAFARRGKFVSFPADALPPHELGFALTVHKSQGSEYDQVLLIVPPEGARRLLTKEILYTGVTRAKQLAVICSQRDVLKQAIARRIEREAGLLACMGGSR